MPKRISDEDVEFNAADSQLRSDVIKSGKLAHYDFSDDMWLDLRDARAERDNLGNSIALYDEKWHQIRDYADKLQEHLKIAVEALEHVSRMHLTDSIPAAVTIADDALDRIKQIG